MFAVKASILLCVLSCSLTFAAVPHGTRLDFAVGHGNDGFSESLEINFRQNYVQIITQSSDALEPTVMLHDYTQGLNVIKKNGKCFVIDRFDDMPQNIENWNPFRATMLNEETEIDEDKTEHVNYHYKVLPLSVDRSSLPEVVQDLCPGVIQVLVLDGVSEGEDSSDGAGEGEEKAEVYLPRQVLQKRVKRQSSRPSWGGSLTGGRNSGGGYVRGTVTGNNGRGTSGSLSGSYNFGSRDWSAGGSVSHQRGSWTSSGRGSYNSRGGGTFGGSVNYNRGSFSAGLSADHNTRTHDTNVRATLKWEF